MNKNAKILVHGANGLVGSAVSNQLKISGYTRILTPTRAELDLKQQSSVLSYYNANLPDFVINAAAKVGGIIANNTYRADFIFENLQIQNNVFEAAFKTKIKKLIFLGSSCIYPKNCPQPIKEEYLLTGPLEPTNEPYAIAKIAGLKCAESFRKQYNLDFISVMPTNLYGPNDNFHKENSHVIPGLIARMYEAKLNNEPTFTVWGTGKPRREFLHSTDLAKAIIFILESEKKLPDWMNIGCGEDIEIGALAKIIAKILNYKGQIIFDTSKPDGTMQKLLDISRIKEMGWAPEISLDAGLSTVINNFLTTR